MSPLLCSSIGLCSPSTPHHTAPTGAIGRQIRQVQRELDQLLDAHRDSPTLRLKIAQARQTLAELQAQLGEGSPVVLAQALTSPAPQAFTLITAPIARPPTPPLPLPAKVPALVWPMHVRVSPLQQMRDRVLLACIRE